MPFIKAPGYLYFLAVVYELTGPSYWGPRIVQALLGLLGAASCLLSFWVGRAIVGGAVGLIHAALMALCWSLVYSEAMLHAPALDVFLLLLVLLLLLQWRYRFSLVRGLVVGVLFGIFALVRKNSQMLIPVGLIWLAWPTIQSGRVKDVIAPACALAGGFMLAIVPIAWRNLEVSGELVLISCDGGRAFYEGNNSATDGAHPAHPEQQEWTGTTGWDLSKYPEAFAALKRRLGRELSHYEFDRYFAHQAWKFIRENPGDLARLILRKALLFWGPMEVSSDRVVHYDRVDSRVLRELPGRFPLVLCLALVGLGFIAREWRPETTTQAAKHGTMLVLVLLLTYFTSILPFLPASRYRVAVIPLLLLFAAVALHRFWHLLRAAKLRPIPEPCGIGGPCPRCTRGTSVEPARSRRERGRSCRPARSKSPSPFRGPRDATCRLVQKSSAADAPARSMRLGCLEAIGATPIVASIPGAWATASLHPPRNQYGFSSWF